MSSLVTGDGTYTFVLKGNVNGDDRWFNSSESTNIPVLRITHTNAPAPTADFVVLEQWLQAPPYNAEFTDLSVDSPTSWQWNFGDGGVSTQQNPTYEYTVNGLYTVTLIATNGAGSDTLIRQDYMAIPEPALLTQLVAGVFGLFMLNGCRKRGERRVAQQSY